jgi:exonuclease III
MKIVSWNCRYGFTLEKLVAVSEYSPDILVIQECVKSDFDVLKSNWNYKNWYNDDLNQEESKLGVAIFSNNHNIEFTEIFNRKYRYVIPYKISNGEHEFILFTVWIKPLNRDYFKPLENAVKYYREKEMLVDNSIIIGDFNTFAKDNNERLKDLENKLSPMINCTSDTQFWKTATYYDATHGYGIDDFCFVSKNIKDKYNIDVNVPDGWDEEKDKSHHWKGLSDHSPIIVNLYLK